MTTKTNRFSFLCICLCFCLAFFACNPTGNQSPTKGIGYHLSADKTCAEVVWYDGTEGDVVIASVYEGVPVTTIAYRAFSFNKVVTSVIIPNSVTFIDENAFAGCLNLTTITIPASVTFMGYKVFLSCRSLTEIVFRGMVEQWDSMTKDIDWRGDAPVKKVKCINGQVEL